MPRQITPPHFQGPIQIVGRVEGDETTDMFACPSRSALRSIDMPTGADKSQGHKVPRTVAATRTGPFRNNRIRPNLVLIRPWATRRVYMLYSTCVTDGISTALSRCRGSDMQYCIFSPQRCAASPICLNHRLPSVKSDCSAAIRSTWRRNTQPTKLNY